MRDTRKAVGMTIDIRKTSRKVAHEDGIYVHRWLTEFGWIRFEATADFSSVWVLNIQIRKACRRQGHATELLTSVMAEMPRGGAFIPGAYVAGSKFLERTVNRLTKQQHVRVL